MITEKSPLGLTGEHVIQWGIVIAMDRWFHKLPLQLFTLEFKLRTSILTPK